MNTFDLCQDGKCVEAASLGSFGYLSNGTMFLRDSEQVDKEKYFLRDTDVTFVLVKQGWTLKKPLVAKMTKSIVDNLPEPVVMYKQLGDDGTNDEKMISIALNPKENPARYGNLIDGYSIKKIEK